MADRYAARGCEIGHRVVRFPFFRYYWHSLKSMSMAIGFSKRSFFFSEKKICSTVLSRVSWKESQDFRWKVILEVFLSRHKPFYIMEKEAPRGFNTTWPRAGQDLSCCFFFFQIQSFLVFISYLRCIHLFSNNIDFIPPHTTYLILFICLKLKWYH